MNGNKATYTHSKLQTVVASLALLGVALLSLSPEATQAATARVKDITNFEGIRDNMLVGYGLVVGLEGTGDNLKNAVFTQKGLEELLSRMGINTRGAALKTKNVAAVTVTANLPPFSRQGSKIDVNISTLGDAKSLKGGTLLATPLFGADGNVYAVGQGSVSIGGFLAADAATGNSVNKGVNTSGFISNGAIIEQEIPFNLSTLNTLNLALKNPDISTAQHLADAINFKMGKQYATAIDPGTVKLDIPEAYKDNIMTFLSEIEQLPVLTDQPAKIVIDESSGTIVMGQNVRIDTVAVAQGNLVVEVTKTPVVSQPGAFAPDSAQTVAADLTNINVSEDKDNKLTVVEGNATLQELVNGLNALGIGPRDMITILQTIKSAGALQAEIETR